MRYPRIGDIYCLHSDGYIDSLYIVLAIDISKDYICYHMPEWGKFTHMKDPAVINSIFGLHKFMTDVVSRSQLFINPADDLSWSLYSDIEG